MIGCYPALSPGIIVAHNAAFDTSVLRSALKDYGITCPDLDYACTYRLAKEAFPNLTAHRLPNVAGRLGISLVAHHDPKEDARVAAEIALALLNRLGASSLEKALRQVGLYQGRMWHGGWNSCGKTPPKSVRGGSLITRTESTTKSTPQPKPMDPKVFAEFSGLIQGILADGRVVQSEAEYLQRWLNDPARKKSTSSFLPNELTTIISLVLEDGVLNESEELLLRASLGACC